MQRRFGGLSRDSDPAGGPVPSSGNSFRACLVVEGCVVALGKREWLGAEDMKGKGR